MTTEIQLANDVNKIFRRSVPCHMLRHPSDLVVPVPLWIKCGPGCIFLSRVKTEKVEKSPGGKMIKFPSSNNANLSEGNV